MGRKELRRLVRPFQPIGHLTGIELVAQHLVQAVFAKGTARPGAVAGFSQPVGHLLIRIGPGGIGLKGQPHRRRFGFDHLRRRSGIADVPVAIRGDRGVVQSLPGPFSFALGCMLAQ